jgi:sigma-E factor negative regulatory protein RseB
VSDNCNRASRYWYGPVLSMAALLAAPAGFAACPGADALDWLDRMSRSVNQVSYQGVVTFQSGGEMQVMYLSHSVAGKTSSERLTRLTGQDAQVVRAGHPLDCVHPGHRLLQVSADLRAGRCGIADYYRFNVGEGDRVAGRKAVRIRIEPRDMYRFGYVMELDRKTGLLLRTETVGRGDTSLEKFQFANLSFNGSVSGEEETGLVHQAQHTPPLEPGAAVVVPGNWTVNWVPPGFTLANAADGDVERRTYTDGLAAFSVFLEPLRREIPPGEGVVRNGSTTSYTRGMRLPGQPVLVTVIGEVPVNTARMVADSIERVR